MKFLIIFLISFNTFAINHYIQKTSAEDCSLDQLVFSGPLANVECSKGGECLEIVDFAYNCEYSQIVDETMDNLEAPINTKSETVSCLDEVHCQNILEAKVCTDSEETAIKNLELLEVYCSKVTGYAQIATGRKIITVDQTKKDAYEAAKLAEENLKIARKDAIEALKVSAISKEWNALTTPERKILMGLEVTNAELGL